MSTPVLITITVVFPGLWGWLIGQSAARWWPRPDEPKLPNAISGPRRLSDYDI